MSLSELIAVLMIITIVLTTVGSSFLTLHVMELNTRTELTPLELQTIIPQILEPFLKCSDLSDAIFMPREITLALRPCLNIIDIQKVARVVFYIRLSQPQERQILIPYERTQQREKQLLIQFSNGCVARLIRIITPTRLEIRILDDCLPVLGKAFPQRDDHATLNARIHLSGQILNLDFGFTHPNGVWQGIPDLSSRFHSIMDFNWTFRVLSHAYLIPDQNLTLLQYDLDRNNNRQLDPEDSPIERIYPAEFIDGLNLFMILRAPKPLPEPVRCGLKLLQPGEYKKCVTVRIRQPV